MKLEDLRDLKTDQVAIVRDGENLIAVSEHNVNAGLCDCCQNYSALNGEVLMIRNAVTGDQVWPEEPLSIYTIGDKTYLLKPGEEVRVDIQPPTE